MRKLISITCFVCLVLILNKYSIAQSTPKLMQRPVLIVGIVVEQMRYDYLVRYWDNFSEGGFKKLVDHGTLCRNTMLNYAITESAPGFASIYTGATPSEHGIVGNFWYERSEQEKVYCVNDGRVKTMGSEYEYGEMSPYRMIAATLGDQLKLFSNNESKVYSVSMKGSSAVLSGGHMADGAFWFDPLGGRWISSSHYYTDSFPDWANNYNLKGLSDAYIQETWNQIIPTTKYKSSHPDSCIFELGLRRQYNTFPYPLPTVRYSIKPYEILMEIPKGNAITLDFALKLMQNEGLGRDENTDLLCISFSACEEIGKLYGPRAMEMEDTYIRLDHDIANLLEYLDEELDVGNVLVFLTSDHGSTDIPLYLKTQGMPAGYFSDLQALALLKSYLRINHGDEEWIAAYSERQIFLDHLLLEKKGKDLYEMQDFIAEFITDLSGVASSMTAHSIQSDDHSIGISKLIENSYYTNRSPDVYFTLAPNWMTKNNNAVVTNNSPYNDVLHVPLIWYGWHVKHQDIWEKVYINDIVPTICQMISVPVPSSANGNAIEKMLR